MFLRRVAYIKHTNENGNAISSLFILPVLRASNKSWARERGNYFIRNSYFGQKQIPSTVYRGYMRTYPKTIRKSEGNGRRRRDSLHFQTRENHAGMNSARSVRPLRSKRFLSLLQKNCAQNGQKILVILCCVTAYSRRTFYKHSPAEVG